MAQAARGNPPGTVRQDGDRAPSRKEKTVMSTITSIQSKASALVHLQALMAGTEKHFPNGSFTLGNATYTTASLVQAFKALADALTVLAAAHTSTRDAVTAVREAETKVTPLLRDYRHFLRATFSTANAPLADFGLAPPRPRSPLSSEKRVVAAAKMRATRVARGTTSKKQKLAIKGDVTGVLVTPITAAGPSSPPTAAPAVPAPAPTPAAPAPAASPPAAH
jgi:hypothetical protein